MMPITDAVEFLEECAEADSNLESTAETIAAAVEEALADIETADSMTRGLSSAVEIIDPVVDVGAQIPVQPCQDLKPVATVLDRVKSRLKTKVLPAMKQIVNSIKFFADTTSVLLPASGTLLGTHPDLRARTADARSVTEQMVAKFGDKLPHDLKEEAERIADAATRAKGVLERPLHDLDDILVGLHKLDPLINLTDGLKPLRKAMQPVADQLDKATGTFKKLAQPLTKALKKINDASVFVRKKVEDAVEGEINKLLAKLGLKANLFKVFEKEVHKVENAVENTLWTPIKKVVDEVEGKLDKEKQKVVGAVHTYVDLRGKIDRVLTPLDDMLKAYIAAAARHGIHPKH